MDDADLENIRTARLQQLKAQAGSSAPTTDVGHNEKQRQEDNARKAILDQILQPEAADRLGRIRLVKQERATDIENRLIMLAQTGQLRQKVTEGQLKELLEAAAEKRDQDSIVVSRRKAWDADDDLEDLLDV